MVEPITKERTQNFIWVLFAKKKHNLPHLKLIRWGVLHRSKRENTDFELYSAMAQSKWQNPQKFDGKNSHVEKRNSFSQKTCEKEPLEKGA